MTKILFSPLTFLTVRYPGSTLIAWVIPCILAMFVVASAFFFQVDVPITGDDGVLKSATSLFTVAGGFFVAALTVLITNDHSVLNSTFVGENKPYIKKEMEPLTRKRFLSLLFGYLSFGSFSIVVICLILTVYRNIIRSLPSNEFVEALIYVAGFIGALIAFQLFMLALVGLHYLTDRLHRSDGRSSFKVIPPKID